MNHVATFNPRHMGTFQNQELPADSEYPDFPDRLNKRPVHSRYQLKKRLLLKRLHTLSLVVQHEEDIFLLFSKYAGELTGMAGAEGVSVNYMGQLKTYGNVPFPEDIEEIILWLDEQRFDDLYYTNSLRKHISQAASLKSAACGVIAIKLAEGQYLIWYRSASSRPAHWQQQEIEIVQVFENYLFNVLLKSRP